MGSALDEYKKRHLKTQTGTGDGKTGDQGTVTQTGTQAAAPSSWGPVLWKSNAQPADTTHAQTWMDWLTKDYKPSPSDFAKVYGDAVAYHTPALAEQGAQAVAGAPVGMSAQDIRQQLEQSRRNLGPIGPFVTATGYLTSPLTYAGVGPLGRLLGGAAESGLARYLPEAVQKYIAPAVSGGTQASTTAAAQTAGAGGDPAAILKSAAEAFPVGGVLGAGATVLTPKGVSPSDVVSKTAADRQALQAQLEKAKYNWKDAGVQVDANQNPSVLDLINQRKWAQSVPPSDDPAGIGPKVVTGVNKALARPPTGGGQTGQQMLDAADAATQQNQMAQLLHRWNETVNVPGSNVTGQAAEQMANYPPGSPEFNAFRNIASAPTSYTPAWLRAAQSLAETTPVAANDVARMAGFHMPGSGFAAQLAGKTLSSGIGKLAGPSNTSALVQQQINQASQPLTGYATSPAGDPTALSNALFYIYQNAQPGGPASGL
jgi:hypothetical protein